MLLHPHITSQFIDAKKFTFNIGATMIREIRQRSKNGQLNTWGLGCVSATFITSRKDLTDIFTQWENTLNEIKPKKTKKKKRQNSSTRSSRGKSKFDLPNSQRSIGSFKRQRTENNRVKKKMLQKLSNSSPPLDSSSEYLAYPRIVVEYYTDCCAKIQAGTIGLVPKLFLNFDYKHKHKHTLKKFMESDTGKLLQHFSTSVSKSLF